MPYILYTLSTFAPNLQVRDYSISFLKRNRLKSLDSFPQVAQVRSKVAGIQTQQNQSAFFIVQIFFFLSRIDWPTSGIRWE